MVGLDFTVGGFRVLDVVLLQCEEQQLRVSVN